MISSSTKNTKKVYSDFATFIALKNKAMLCIYICSVIIVVCGIISILLENDVFEGILFLVLGVFFALYGVLMRFIIILSNKKNYDTINNYEFNDNNFIVTLIDKDGKQTASSTINYEVLQSLKLYKNYAYVYVNKAACYILVKENFKDENEFNQVIDNIKKNIVYK